MSIEGMTRTVLLTELDRALREDGVVPAGSRSLAYGEATSALMGQVMSELAEARGKVDAAMRIALEKSQARGELRSALGTMKKALLALIDYAKMFGTDDSSVDAMEDLEQAIKDAEFTLEQTGDRRGMTEATLTAEKG